MTITLQQAAEWFAQALSNMQVKGCSGQRGDELFAVVGVNAEYDPSDLMLSEDAYRRKLIEPRARALAEYLGSGRVVGEPLASEKGLECACATVDGIGVRVFVAPLPASDLLAQRFDVRYFEVG